MNGTNSYTIETRCLVCQVGDRNETTTTDSEEVGQESKDKRRERALEYGLTVLPNQIVLRNVSNHCYKCERVQYGEPYSNHVVERLMGVVEMYNFLVVTLLGCSPLIE